MDGVHDMGGMHGFGAVRPEANDAAIHEPWEARVHALGGSSGMGLFPNIDASRYALETLPPAQYLVSTYYERWLLRLERRLVELGHISPDELAERMTYYREHPDAPVPRGANPGMLERTEQRFSNPSKPLHRPDGAAPRFSLGETVRTRNIHPAGHTRLPRYARGKLGAVEQVHGRHDFPDTRAHGLGGQPQAVYRVRFSARELWGEDGEGSGSVCLDLWDSYLEPVRAGEVPTKDGGQS
jgi:nitrile hydratase